MDLNGLLVGKGISPGDVLVMRHTAKEGDLNKILPSLAADQPDLFNAYQKAQLPNSERAMASGRYHYLASFIGHEPGTALFVGLYKIQKFKRLTYDQYWKKRSNQDLKQLGMTGLTSDRPSCLWFDLRLLPDFYSSWKGRLVIDWPPGRAWFRRAERSTLPVHAILEDSALDRAMTNWNELDLSWQQLKNLPRRWQQTLEQWRGIYYIFDTSDSKGYVGSAYGSENLFGRWCNHRRPSSYAASGHGGNSLLKKRKPEHFHFTILELVGQSMEQREVFRRESNWKERLHTRAPYGLNEN